MRVTHWSVLGLMACVMGCSTAVSPNAHPDGGSITTSDVPILDIPSVPTDTPQERMCLPIMANEIRAPQVRYVGFQPMMFSVRAGGGGSCCGLELMQSNPTSFSMAACNCCDVCDCIDMGYEANYVESTLGGTGPGLHTYNIAGMQRTVMFAQFGSGTDLTPTGLRVIPPDEFVRRTGPELWWAVIQYEDALCCAEPMTGVTSPLSSPTGEVTLSLHSHVTQDCFCEPVRRSYEVWHPLQLSAGRHAIRAGQFTINVNVP